jgi:hypothetical protein
VFSAVTKKYPSRCDNTPILQQIRAIYKQEHSKRHKESSKVQEFKGSRKPHHELVNNYVDNRPPGEVREASAAAESRVLSLLNL